jgi:hypothetical protein
VERTTTLIRAMNKHRRDARPGRSHPNQGYALWTVDASSNAKTTSVCAGQSLWRAPRRNRTGDPILTMEPPGTAVRTTVSAGHARPSGPKLSALSTCSYAFSCIPRALSTIVPMPSCPLGSRRTPASSQVASHRKCCSYGVGATWSRAGRQAGASAAASRPMVGSEDGARPTLRLSCRQHCRTGPPTPGEQGSQ